MWLLVIAVVFVIVIVMSMQESNEANRILGDKLELKIQDVTPNPAYRCNFSDKDNYYLVSYIVHEDCESISFLSVRRKEKQFVFETKKIDVSDIIEVNVECDGEVAGGVGRAVVGGLMAGGVGAIVGAQTAKKKIMNFSISIVCKSVSCPIQKIPLRSIPVDTDSEVYKSALDFSRKVCASIKTLIDASESR